MISNPRLVAYREPSSALSIPRDEIVSPPLARQETALAVHWLAALALAASAMALHGLATGFTVLGTVGGTVVLWLLILDAAELTASGS